MEKATEKQITFAKSLGMANPETYSKDTLKEMISKKLESQPKQADKPESEAVSDVIKGILINKTQDPNSYEFGKAGNRFKLYFSEISELKGKIEALKEAGLYTDEE